MPPRFITIPFSHYCEKARWALDRSGIDYIEEPHVPGFSGIAARRAGGKRSVPVLAIGDGTVLSDSTDILRWVDRNSGGPQLFANAAAAALEDDFDLRLGPAARRVAYQPLLAWPQLPNVLFSRAPRWEMQLRPVLGKLLVRGIRSGLRIDDAGVARSKIVIDEIFAKVEALLADGRRYLTGNSFTAADLTFAALAAPLVWPDGYAKKFDNTYELPADVLAMFDHYRATVAGAFILRMYDEHRS